MNEIITITQIEINDAEVNSVNARDLHTALGLKSDFSTWIKKELLIFEENSDYIKLHKKMERQTLIEYILTIDTSKHLSMIQRNDKGKEIRDYFIAVEKEANKPMSQIDMMIAQLQMTKDLENKVNIIESKFDKIIDDVVEIVEKHNPSEIKPSVSFLPVKALMSRYGMSNQTVMKVVSAFDPRVEDCSKFVDGVGISEYQAYNRKDMDRAVKTIMETAKVVSKLYYTSIYINGRFQCSLV